MTEPDAPESGASIPEAAVVAPILRHLLVNDNRSLFNDAIVARVRGMVGHVAAQLLFARAEAAGTGDPAAGIAEHQDALAAALCAHDAFLVHVHARAVEGQIAEQLQQRSGLDPVLAPLIQDFVASPDAETAARGMALVAAQTRFVQHHRRMELPLQELPAELFHIALRAFRACDDPPSGAEEAARRLRQAYDEAAGRLALLARLAMAAEGAAALALDRAGVSLFATAVALAADTPREAIVLALTDRELPRLAAALQVAGLDAPTVEAQLLQLQPDGAFLPLARRSEA